MGSRWESENQSVCFTPERIRSLRKPPATWTLPRRHGCDGSGRRSLWRQMAETFPRLTASRYRDNSPPDVGYNCVAWAAGDTQHWWQPGIHWPVLTSRDDFGVAHWRKRFVRWVMKRAPTSRSSRASRKSRSTVSVSSTHTPPANWPTASGPASSARRRTSSTGFSGVSLALCGIHWRMLPWSPRGCRLEMA